jgi:hypothetical protein
VRALPRIRLALPMVDPDIMEAVADRMVIESDTPLSYMIDGDFIQGGQRLEVRVGPRVALVI